MKSSSKSKIAAGSSIKNSTKKPVSPSNIDKKSSKKSENNLKSTTNSNLTLHPDNKSQEIFLPQNTDIADALNVGIKHAGLATGGPGAGDDSAGAGGLGSNGLLSFRFPDSIGQIETENRRSEVLTLKNSS